MEPVIFLKKKTAQIALNVYRACTRSQMPEEKEKEVPILSATNNAINVDVYVDRLTHLLNRESDVREIAITAPYSGGKSSFLKTYKYRHPEFNYISISLGSFNDKSSEDDKKTSTSDSLPAKQTDKESIGKIEKSIVQQILYRTNIDKNSNSRFRRILTQPEPLHKQLFVPAVTMLWALIVTATYLYYSELNDFFLMAQGAALYGWAILAAFALGYPVVVLNDLLKLVGRMAISSLNPIKGEIALSEKRNDSIFNIYLEEIIYYFATSKVEVVIFEDIDRLKEVSVFSKLKELNKLINDSAQVGQTVRFVYALKDDIFTGEARTKFFDAIIPIVPISNTYNSYPRVKEILHDTGCGNDLEDSFLRDICVYLSEMRTIKNIVSEYLVYKNILSESISGFRKEKLFSYMVYKNVYCDDFALLQSGEGAFIDILNSVKGKVDGVRRELSDEIANLEESILASESECTQSIEELNAGAILKFIQASGITRGIYAINDIQIGTLVRDENFEAQIKNPKACTFRYQKGQHVENFPGSQPFEATLRKIMPDYERRKNNITNKTKSKRVGIQGKILSSQDKLQRLSSLAFKDKIEAVGSEEVFGEITDKPLLIHLVISGLLDEDYLMYISHFIEGDMTRNDMDYFMSIKSRKKVAPETRIDNPAETFKKLKDPDFKASAFANYDMINFMLKNNKVLAISTLIENVLYGNYDLTVSVIKNIDGDVLVDFVKVLSVSWPGVVEDIVSSTETNESEKCLFLIDIISMLSNDSDLDRFLRDDQQIIRNFVEASDVLPEMEPADPARRKNMMNSLAFIGVKFPDISKFSNNRPFIQRAMESSVVLASHANIVELAKLVDNNVQENSIDYSWLARNDTLGVSDFLSSNINEVASLISKGQLLVSDKDDFIDILKSGSVGAEIKNEIIACCDFKAETVSGIEDTELLQNLLNYRRVMPKWGIIGSLSLIEDDKVLTSLKELILDEVFAMELCNDEGNVDAGLEMFLYQQVLNDQSPPAILLQYINRFNWAVSIDECSPDQLSYLITNDYFEFSEENLSSLQELDLNLAALLVAVNFTDFISGASEINDISTPLFYRLLTSQDIDLRKKAYLLQALPNRISTDEDNEKIADILLKFPEKVEFPKLNHAQILSVISSCKNFNEKVRVLTTQLKHLNSDDSFSAIAIIGGPFSSFTAELLRGKKISIKLSQENIAFANALKDNKTIYKSSQAKVRGTLTLYFNG